MVRLAVYLLAGVAAISLLFSSNIATIMTAPEAEAESGGAVPGSRYGILGRQAPDLTLSNWIDAQGNAAGTIDLKDYRGKVIYLYFFQHWCPGCHAHGFPTLQTIARAFKGNGGVALMAVQTAFEGKSINTADKLRRNQIDYELAIPMAHDNGEGHPRGVPRTMIDFRTGGTPWAVIIDPGGKVVYNDFHIDAPQAIYLMKKLLAAGRQQ